MDQIIQTALSHIMLNKLKIKSLSRDIKAVRYEINVMSEFLESTKDILAIFLRRELYHDAKALSKKINALEKSISNLECVVKTLLATRKPFEDECIELRSLINKYQSTSEFVDCLCEFRIIEICK